MHGNAGNIFRWRPVMLFYTTLFITSLIAMFVVLWLLRLIASLARSIYRTRLPNAKQSPTAHLNKKIYGKNSKLASKAWGRKPHATPANLARTHPAKAENLIRYSQSGLSGQAYKPSQDARSTFAIDKK
jgi:hypothetical protein